ncbi:hypothetical protein ABZS61_11615 [Streptomyces sp. NPDC005566]
MTEPRISTTDSEFTSGANGVRTARLAATTGQLFAESGLIAPGGGT